MANFIRKYPDAPTAEEVEQGYAPSAIKGAPFAKFLFWTFAGLAIAAGIGWVALEGLDSMERAEQARQDRLAVRQPAEFRGYRLQPSPGHPTLDFEDTAIMYQGNRQELAAKGWQPDPKRPGQVMVSQAVIDRTAELMKQQAKSAPATRPVAEVR